MNAPRDMATEVTEWARENDNVRIAILTSTRASPNAPVDVLSDYDIKLFVRDLEPFLEGDDWLRAFGDVMIREPLRPVEFEGEKCVWRLVMFTDGPRIDFHINLLEVLEADVSPDRDPPRVPQRGKVTELPEYYDMGYEILLDKDSLAQGLTPPTFAAYQTRQPTRSEYDDLVNEFWFDVTYVAKYLFRDELFYAKHMLDGPLRQEHLATAIAWYIGMNGDWQINPGAHGRWFKRHLEPPIWSEIEATFVGADLDQNWEAMFRTAEVFGRLASDIGSHLGFAYPHELARGVTAHLRAVRHMADSRATSS